MFSHALCGDLTDACTETRSNLTLRKLVLILAAVCLSTLIATVLILQLPSKQDEGTETSLNKIDTKVAAYAYITSRELVLMRGDKVVTRLQRIFDETDSRQNKVSWTHSGDYVLLLSDAKLRQKAPSEQELIYVDTHTGEQHLLPCPKCDDFTPIEDNGVLASSYVSGVGRDATAEFTKFDLKSPGAGVSIKFPPDNGSGYSRFFLSSTRRYVLTQQGVERPGHGYQQKLDLIKLSDMSTIKSGLVPPNGYVAAIEDPSSRNAKFAVAVDENPGKCAGSSTVLILDTNGDVIRTNMSNIETSVAQEAIGVSDLRWESNGNLHATITSWACDETKKSLAEQQVLADPPTLWKFDGQTWVKEGLSPATMVRQLDPDTRITLIIPDCIGKADRPDAGIYCNTGTLYRDQNGQRSRVAEGVISISTPPPAAPSPSPPSMPPGSSSPSKANPVPNGVSDLYHAPVPSLCGHPAGTLVDGSLPGIPEVDGYVALRAKQSPQQAGNLVSFGDLTGDGITDVAAVFGCSHGGVDWPNKIVLYSPGSTILGTVDLRDITPAEHSDVDRITIEGGDALIRWKSYEGADSCLKEWSAHLHWDGKKAQIMDLTQIGGIGPGVC
jgi:hypothetical protein